ncbi:MAG: lysophospholipase [Eudoraea sp.]|nr:lysophospholipase [Eudoraea sp.]
MKFTDFSFEVFNTVIRGKTTRPDKPRGVIVIVHGFGEHSGRYKEMVIPALLHEGLAVVIYDNIGHGTSGGKRGHCPNYGALLEILEKVIAKANSLFTGLPLFLYGHSLGGNLVLNFALEKPHSIKAIVASSPYLRLAFTPPKWKLLLGNMMRYVLPSITLSSGLDPKGISGIPEEVEKYLQDPLIHDKVSPMYSIPVIRAGEQAIARADQLTVPTLLVHGSDDPIIAPEGSEEFHKNAKTTTLVLFKGGYHELHNDFCAGEFLETVRNWLRKQL